MDNARNTSKIKFMTKNSKLFFASYSTTKYNFFFAQFDYRSYSTNHNYYPHALIDYRMLNFTHVRPAMFKLNSYRIPIASTMFLNDFFCEFYTYVACVIFFRSVYIDPFHERSIRGVIEFFRRQYET